VRWPGSPGGPTSATPAAAASLAAGGVAPSAPASRDPAKDGGRVWTLEDPFPLKHYLAQP
jgi:hypothetical protein